MRRVSILFLSAVGFLAMHAVPAAASVTIGQVADPNAGNCDAGTEFVQLGVASGNPYVVPGNGTITSWTVQAGGDPGRLTMKIFRKLADPATYQVVGSTGPQMLTPGGTAGNTFRANVRVRQGDLLGLHTVTFTPCQFKNPGSRLATFSGDLADGASGPFVTAFDDVLLDIQATFVPDNTFSLGGTTHSNTHGTATLTLNLPNPGDLTVSGNGVKAASASRATSKSVGAGPAQLLIRAKGKRSKTLNRTGKVKLNVGVIYTPTGGDPATQSLKVKLIKR